MSKNMIDDQLESILIMETRRLYEKAEIGPLDKEEVQKLDILLSINEKRKSSKNRFGSLAPRKYSPDELLEALLNGRDSEQSGQEESKSDEESDDRDN